MNERPLSGSRLRVIERHFHTISAKLQADRQPSLPFLLLLGATVALTVYIIGMIVLSIGR